MTTSVTSEKWLAKRLWWRYLAWALAGLVALWGVTWLAVPPLFKAQVQSRLSAQLGRTVTVGAVDFKPWSLELTLRDVAVARVGQGRPDAGPAATPTATPQLSFKRLYIDMELQSLVRLAPVVDALVLDSLTLQVTHLGQGRYDVDDVLARLAPASPAKDEAPLHYALYNLVVANAAVTFDDTAHGQVHRLSQLNLSLPFLSNLASKRQVLVTPRLSFDLNGSAFDSAASATPFAQTHKTDAQLHVKGLDLAPYLSYLPATLPVRLQSALLDADVKLAFEQRDEPAVTLSGTVTASAVTVGLPTTPAAAAPAGRTAVVPPPWLSFERLRIDLQDVQPLAHQAHLSQIDLVGPHLRLQRDRAGVLNLPRLGPTDRPKNTIKNKAASPEEERDDSQKDAQTLTATGGPAWRVQVDAIGVSGGTVLWLDQRSRQPVRQQLSDLSLQAHALVWPLAQPLTWDGQVKLAGAQLRLNGQASDRLATVDCQLSGLPLSLAAPYLADVLRPQLDGVLSTDLRFSWAAAQAGQPAQTHVDVARLVLDKLTLAEARQPPLAGIGQVRVGQAAIDLAQRRVTVGQLRVTRPELALRRATDGRWMFEDWLARAAPPRPDVPRPATGKATGKSTDKLAAPWRIALDDGQLTDGRLRFADAAVTPAVAVAVSGLSLQVKNFDSATRKPFAVALAASARHGHTEPGRLQWRGSTRLEPLALNGSLTATRLPLQALAPYLSDVLNVVVLRADTSFQGRVDLGLGAAGPSVALAGDAALDDLQVQTLASAATLRAPEELLNWKSLSLTGLKLAMAPGQATQVDVAGTVLSDFYARVILDEAGRLNLQDLLRRPTPASAGPTAPTAAVAAASASTAGAATPAARLRFGPVSLVGGHVNLTDRFIQPNYSADLTELVGRLSAFSSEPVNGTVALADVALRGRAQGTATLEVLGQLNPLVQPVVLDVTGKVRDLELAPLSTYSARYAGYGIERGKLSVDVAYKVLPDGQLTANNKLVLNQLKFGEPIPNAASTLPVKLAVALLADRNGVIDIDLPVSGSLNDPQFRLLPIVFKIIGNLIVKAITAPFNLLASALGGGGDALSMVSFDAGSAALSDTARAGLDKVAQALHDRPGLKMTVVGTASLEVERDAYKRQQLQALVLAQKRRAAGAVLTVPADEYPALLRAVYKQADFPKPRNLIGLAKDLPVPDMEALLLAHLDASEAAMQTLAVQRGVAVRDYLASLKLPTERLFLGAAKAVTPEAKWRPRAELNLSTQ